MNYCKIEEIDPMQAGRVISTRQPLGLFYLFNNGVYIGIDNSTGHSWVEEFPSLQQCKEWLRDPSLIAPSLMGV